MSEEKTIKKTEKIKKTEPIQTQLVEKKQFNDWFFILYDVDQITPGEILDMYNTFKYLGFNRELVLQQLFELTNDIKLSHQIIMACALRGPQAASKLKLSNDRTIQAMGIPASGGKGSTKLTCSRITSATADLAAFLLKKANVPKRMNSELPGWLQFPAAGSIKLPEKLRELHRDFSKRFSTVIGGEFNEGIYEQMVSNAYLDERLRLFEST
jgi:hypothetical protein